MQDAAVALNMSKTVINRQLRRLGVARWPYRMRVSLSKLAAHTQTLLARAHPRISAATRAPRLPAHRSHVHHCRERLCMLPACELRPRGVGGCMPIAQQDCRA